MKYFINKIILFSLFPFLLLALSFFIADGTTDEFYVRFTTPEQKSMIVGTSRAAQGIQPSIIDSILNKNKQTSALFNYSFTVAHSPYGPAYYESIKRKLDKSSKDGKFIIAVDPWSLSLKKEKLNDENIFPENDMAVGKTRHVNCYPNFEYLIHSYSSPLLMIWMTKILSALHIDGKERLYLHKDGWLEVSVSMDSAEVQKRIERKINDYKTNEVPYFHLSPVRYEYLRKTIELFRKHGDVFLVRLPVHANFKDLEDRISPRFDSLMTSLARENNIAYLNFINDSTKYRYTDGNHLYKESGRKLSKKIGEYILNCCPD